VNGWVTNLVAQTGNYATVGRNEISITDADSFWEDAYFEETQLAFMHEGNPAEIKLMSYRQIVSGKVGSVARGINVSNAQTDQQGLATVNPIFTWVRLAQRAGPLSEQNWPRSNGIISCSRLTTCSRF
jgi:multidrug resistance efflux pump